MSFGQLQIALLAQIARDFTNFKKTGEARRTANYLASRLIILDDNYAASRRYHEEILSGGKLEPELKKEDLVEVYENIQDTYQDYRCDLLDAMDKCKAVGASPSTKSVASASGAPTAAANASDLRLPTLQIPTFSGSYTKWRSYHDVFTSMIHNNTSLDEIQKLHHLKSSLSGEAERLIQHLGLEAGNYLKAWELLKSRYDHKRILVNAQLKLFFGQSTLTQESVSGIKSIWDTSLECFHNLDGLGVPVSQWDVMLIYIMLQKLPAITQQLWEERLGASKDFPKFTEFCEFLEARFRTLEAVGPQKSAISNSSSNSKVVINKRAFHTRQNKKPETFICKVCNKGQHPIRTCNRFVRMDITERCNTVSQLGLCSNCLAYSHLTEHCPSQSRCYFCQQNHHSLLHRSSDRSVPSSSPLITVNPNAPTFQPTRHEPVTREVRNHLAQHNTNHLVLLATAVLKVSNPSGMSCTLRALIDPGSEATFITESAAHSLRLNFKRANVNVSGLGQVSSGICHKFVDIVFGSLHSTFKTGTRAYVLKSLTGLLPAKGIEHTSWKHIQGLNLADPNFDKPAAIDLLLGSDIFSEIVLPEIIRGEEMSPIAQSTKFGWILLGKIPAHSENHLHSFVQFCDVDTQLKRFWEIEEAPYNVHKDEEDEACERFYLDTTTRKNDGRYEVCLPFKGRCKPALGPSKSGALRRFHQLENRFETNPTLHKEYAKCINEYLELNHMTEVDEYKDDVLRSAYHYFVPHHAVFKESSTTTKLRVVFDAAAKCLDGTSLNQHLMIGPKTQNSIIDVMLKWRSHKYTFTADIEKMYRQIRVSPEDAYYQLIFWRNNKGEEVKVYRLDTVTFGTASAPYLAIRTLNKLATDEEHRFPIGAKTIREDMYVDDLISGGDSLEETKNKLDEIRKVLLSGGFTLRKWTSNSEEILREVPEDQREIGFSFPLAPADNIKALGIRWFPADDVFSFQGMKFETSPNTTKRGLLSIIARLFDPLGWISPCIVKAKILMQSLWCDGLTWDQPLPPTICEEWEHFRQELPAIEQIKIPRWVNTRRNFKQLEVHGFSDASEKAYGAAIYLRVLDENGEVKMFLLISKTRVAPLKTITLPRLELCAAVILAALLEYVVKVLSLDDSNLYAWSDSRITLAWITSHPSKWKTFVSHRVAEIQRCTSTKIWKYVPTQHNPADLLSRGLYPLGLIKNNFWWNGPAFLNGNWKFSLPQQPSVVETEEEERKIHVHHAIGTESDLDILMAKYSSLQKLYRVIAYCKRFIYNCRNAPEKRNFDTLSPAEVYEASNVLIKSAQQGMFQESSTPRGLKSLNPFFDNDKVMRVGGRLQHSNLSYDQRHPIILKPDHHLSKLIIRDSHHKTYHGGVKLMIAYLRNRFWILNCKSPVKKCIHTCNICFRFRAKPIPQLMGNLPSPRVQISRPFSYTGVDYAGPIDVKAWKGRGSKSFKAYFAIFICLATKAIHIEVVSDMTTQAFLAAFRRFTARRGLCKELFSDCGTNFIGANTELQKMLKAASCSFRDVADAISNDGTKWNFIPPASPHFGGLWEAGVKSVKFHLRRLVQNEVFTFEELCTLLAQIEGCLNSRPLCPLTDDPEDLSALTPAHFLIGEPIRSVPQPDLTMEKTCYGDRWQRLQKITHTFWKQWNSEYLARLQQRPKWLDKKKQPNIGDLVLVKDERLPPSKWMLARIKLLHPGADQLTRVVTLRTQNGEFKRPITKICPLPSNRSTSDEAIL